MTKMADPPDERSVRTKTTCDTTPIRPRPAPMRIHGSRTRATIRPSAITSLLGPASVTVISVWRIGAVRMIGGVTAALGATIWRPVEEVAVKHASPLTFRIRVHILLNVLWVKVMEWPPATARGNYVRGSSSFASSDQLAIGIVAALLSGLILNAGAD
jgi:hypothetical protein